MQRVMIIFVFPEPKAELRAIFKSFPKVTEDIHRLLENFNIII